MKGLALAEASPFIFPVDMPCRLYVGAARPAFSSRVTGILSLKAWLHGPVSAESRAFARYGGTGKMRMPWTPWLN